jgi:uncharacterized protein YqgV (UPF0045/DUF77 family)
MSVIVEFSIFPLDKGESLSAYVARALNLIQEVMNVVDQCFQELQKDCSRISLALKADYRKGPPGRLKGKVESVKEKLKM